MPVRRDVRFIVSNRRNATPRISSVWTGGATQNWRVQSKSEDCDHSVTALALRPWYSGPGSPRTAVHPGGTPSGAAADGAPASARAQAAPAVRCQSRPLRAPSMTVIRTPLASLPVRVAAVPCGPATGTVRPSDLPTPAQRPAPPPAPTAAPPGAHTTGPAYAPRPGGGAPPGNAPGTEWHRPAPPGPPPRAGDAARPPSRRPVPPAPRPTGSAAPPAPSSRATASSGSPSKPCGTNAARTGPGATPSARSASSILPAGAQSQPHTKGGTGGHSNAAATRRARLVGSEARAEPVRALEAGAARTVGPARGPRTAAPTARECPLNRLVREEYPGVTPPPHE